MCSTPPASQLTVRPLTAPPAIEDTFRACQSRAGDHQKTDSVPSGDTPPTCSTIIGPLVACHAVTSPATARPVFAVTSTTCQSRAGVQKNTSNSLFTPRAPRCSTFPPAPSGVTQLTGAPTIFLPVFADTLTACQSRCGDHQKTMRSPAGEHPATCSTRNGPFGVCQLVTPPTTCWPVFAVTLTTCQSCCGDHQNTRSSPAAVVGPTCSRLHGSLVRC